MDVFRSDGEWMYRNVSSHPCKYINVKVAGDTVKSYLHLNFPMRKLSVTYLDQDKKTISSGFVYVLNSDSARKSSVPQEQFVGRFYCVHDSSSGATSEIHSIESSRKGVEYDVGLLYSVVDRLTIKHIALYCWDFGTTQISVYKSTYNKDNIAINGGNENLFAERIGFINSYFLRFDSSKHNEIPHGPLLWYRDSEIYYEPGVAEPEICYFTSNKIPDDQNKIEIFPNPGKNKLFITYGADLQGGILTLTDLRGSIILTQELNANAEFDVSQLPAGLYFISMQEGSRLRHWKWMKE